MPTDIVRFLKLPNSELYTGHCFRRTSASLLADSGANLCTIKRHGGWKSSSVAEGYMEDSLENKKRIACHILPNNCPSSNNSEIEHINKNQFSQARLDVSSINYIASAEGVLTSNEEFLLLVLGYKYLQCFPLRLDLTKLILGIAKDRFSQKNHWQQKLVPLSDTKSVLLIARCHALLSFISEGNEINNFSGALVEVDLMNFVVEELSSGFWNKCADFSKASYLAFQTQHHPDPADLFNTPGLVGVERKPTLTLICSVNYS
ncbi:hypothetical protein NQ317_006590 [Molorchus minor]|uniref:Tyr recombinase domain-containing protein n=1 Tax=Molorchus minor TaxID=1323400 RepID=A0ABQ9JYV3_9CUCU|nr:hypothetical protein NQ317_006590 [Molorchus minor]